jgi:hypothetical protein
MSLIFTNHALARLKERGFTKEQAYLTFSSPDNVRSGKKNNTWEYTKKFDKQTIILIVTNNNQNEKIVISAWINPPLPGTKDAIKRQKYWQYHKSSPLRKIWLIIKEQLGF